MGGGNMYCCICGGPTCYDPCIDEEDQDGDGDGFQAIAGVTADDVDWLYHNSVAVYADCVSPAGTYNWDWAVTVDGPSEESDAPEEPDTDEKRELLDPVTVPDWVKANQPGSGRYSVGEDANLAHQTCIYLAAEFSKAENPRRFKQDGPADPAKFFWDDIGPVLLFLCQVDINDASEETLDFQLKSEETRKALGNPQQLDMTSFYRKHSFKYGYKPDDAESEWLEGCEQEFTHKKEFGIKHLKRPDHFPAIHHIDTPIQFENNLFPIHIPLELIIHIITEGELGGPEIRALECVSRCWRDFFQTPVMQIKCWKDRVVAWEFIPNAADWTESAEAVRKALKKPQSVDWRRYYNDARKSLNLANRERIMDSVRQLDHGMGNCECAKIDEEAKAKKGQKTENGGAAEASEVKESTMAD